MKHIHLPGLLTRHWKGAGIITWSVGCVSVVSLFDGSAGEVVLGNMVRDLRVVTGPVICSGGDWSARLVTPIQKDIMVRKLFKRKKK